MSVESGGQGIDEALNAGAALMWLCEMLDTDLASAGPMFVL